MAPLVPAGGIDPVVARRARVPPCDASSQLNVLLLLVNVVTFAFAASEFASLRVDAVVSPAWELWLSHGALLGVCVAGLCLSVVSTVRMCWGHPPLASHGWKRLHVPVLQFLAVQFVFEALMASRSATAWALPNAAGRTRLVHPLRYVTWASTNSYIILAVAVALGVSQRDTLRSCASVVACTLAAFPLELTPAGLHLWVVSFALSCAALAYCLALIGHHIVGSIARSGSRAYTTVMSLTFAVVVASYCSFAVVFCAAQLCGGGSDDEHAACFASGAETCSCLTIESEAAAWRAVEVTAKIGFLAVIVLAAVCTTPPRVTARHVIERLHSAPPRASWTASVLHRLAPILGLSLAVGVLTFAVQHVSLGGFDGSPHRHCGALCSAGVFALSVAVAGAAAAWTFVLLLKHAVEFASLGAITSAVAPPDDSHGFRCAAKWRVSLQQRHA